MKEKQLIAILVGAVWIQACGGASVPHQQQTAAQASVRAAEVGGAESLPQAELHLKYARDGIQEAEKLIEKGKNEEAELLLRRAEADAELALALAEENQTKLQAQEAHERVLQLTEQ